MFFRILELCYWCYDLHVFCWCFAYRYTVQCPGVFLWLDFSFYACFSFCLDLTRFQFLLFLRVSLAFYTIFVFVWLFSIFVSGVSLGARSFFCVSIVFLDFLGVPYFSIYIFTFYVFVVASLTFIILLHAFNYFCTLFLWFVLFLHDCMFFLFFHDLFVCFMLF